MLDHARALGLGDRARVVGGRRVDHQDLVEERERARCISRIARRTMGPTVSASLRVGSTRLTVTPCFSLSVVSRARSPNSEWWKLASANQRSTRAGIGPGLLGGTIGRCERLGALGELLEGLAPDRLARLDHDHGGLGARGDRPPEAPRTGSCRHRPVGADAPITTRSARSASRRIAVRTFGASRRIGSERAVTCWRDERGQCMLGLGSHGLRDAGRHQVHDRDGCAVAVRDRVREPERQLRVRAAAHGDEDPPDLLRAPLLDDRDVARRLADDLVDGGRDHRTAGVAGASRTCRPSRR